MLSLSNLKVGGKQTLSNGLSKQLKGRHVLSIAIKKPRGPAWAVSTFEDTVLGFSS